MYFECHIETNLLTDEQKKSLKEQSSCELFGFYQSEINDNNKKSTYFNISNDRYEILYDHMNRFCVELIRTDICIKRKKIELIVYDSRNKDNV